MLTEFERMVELLDLAWSLRSEIVPCLVGPPGIGKTAAVKLHAEHQGCGKVVKIVASRCIPSETVGMTMPDHKHRSMDIYNSMQLSSLEDGDILFLDELLEADQFVLSTLLTVIESREMADGTPLPDIQIIAATNSTIPPEQLRGNIRQRFMFEKFCIDLIQTRNYIRSLTGMDIPDSVLRNLTADGPDYNFLTPRSLVKLCLWMDAVDDPKELSIVIDNMWQSNIGSQIRRAMAERDSHVPSAAEQLKSAIKAVAPGVAEMYDFEDCSFDELLKTLKSLPDWDVISEQLAGIELVEHQADTSDNDVRF